MAQNFNRDKRKIEEAKKKRREEKMEAKRLKKAERESGADKAPAADAS